ncbi:MAG: hypothetical protein QM831_42425 [Kofleriaceae bacterium]
MPVQRDLVIAAAALAIAAAYTVCAVDYREAQRYVGLIGVTKKLVDQIAFVDIPAWQVRHPDTCPATASDVTTELRDGYGELVQIQCTNPILIPWQTPSFVVISAGEDGRFNTADDIRSDRHDEVFPL